MRMDPLIPSASGGIAASDIHTNDVLCGRGCVISSHPGNEYFRMLVESKNFAYATSRSKREKTSITWSIVEEIKARTPPGRFLTKSNSPRGKRKKSKQPQTWYEIDDTKAREKVAQALREKAPQLRDATTCSTMRKHSSERRGRGDGKSSISTPQKEGKTAPPHVNGTENLQPHDNLKRPAMSSQYTSVVSNIACPSNEDENYLAHYADQHDLVAQHSSIDLAASIYNEKQHGTSNQWNAESGHSIVPECINNKSSEASDLDRRKESKVVVIERSETSDSAVNPVSPIWFLPETRYKCLIHHQQNASNQLHQQSTLGPSDLHVYHPLTVLTSEIIRL